MYNTQELSGWHRTYIKEVIVTDTTTQVPNQEAKSNWRNNKILEEEQLEEIYKRPPLWNFKLPISERSIQAKKKLWEEIKVAMNGNVLYS